MDPATFAAVMAALSPLLVAFFTWLTRRGLDRRAVEAQTRAAEAQEYENRLTQQREDFKALMDPLQDTVAALRDRVEHLEEQVTNARRISFNLARSLDQVLEYLEREYQDQGPSLAKDVQEYLERR